MATSRKQLAHTIGGKPRGRLGPRLVYGRGWPGRIGVRPIDAVAQFGVADGALEIVELFVQQAGFMAVPDLERVEPGSYPRDLGGAFRERGLAGGHAYAQAGDLVAVRLAVSDEAGHL